MDQKMDQKNTEKFATREPARFGFGVRHIQLTCMFLVILVLFVVRSSMAVAVLAMSDQNRRNDTNTTIYDWDKTTQSIILSSFFWGYWLMQIPAGILAKKFGGKPILLVALIANGGLCLVLPLLADLGGWKLVCAARMGMGLTQACLFPASHTLLGRWLPSGERTSYAGIVYGGSQIGTIVAMPLSGILAETLLGWKLIFYSMGALLTVTAVLWAFLSASSPGQHPRMTVAEKKFIEYELNTGHGDPGPQRIPWGQFMRSRPFWAILVAHVGCNAVFVLFFVDLPTYLEKGLGISLKNSALLSALPYMGMWAGGLVSAVLCQKIQDRRWLSVANCRRVFNSVGMYGVSLGLLVLALLSPEQATLAIAVLVATLMMNGFCSAGFMISHLDLSPNFAGLLLSLTNFSANVVSIINPILTGVILRNDPTDVGRWHIVFLMVAAICVITNTVYIVELSDQRQPWDDPGFGRPAIAEQLKPVMNEEKDKEANGFNNHNREDMK